MVEKIQTTAVEINTKQIQADYFDSLVLNEGDLADAIKGNIPIRFDWNNKWLKGDEYSHIL